LKSIVKRYEKKIPIPIIHTDKTSINPYKILRELLEKLKKTKEVEKNTCAFVGFPHQK